MAKSESEELFADRYRVVELLGEGGMGRVLKCHDRELDRYVAIKVLFGDQVGCDQALQKKAAVARSSILMWSKSMILARPMVRSIWLWIIWKGESR
ncbi:MAG: hypothetical protein R3D26_17505 [Cyanobacteriota/Melainabacteria group bacterium]